jgi:hypothetical protein
MSFLTCCEFLFINRTSNMKLVGVKLMIEGLLV